MDSIKINDINNFSFLSGKLNNLNNILIPNNVNPLNYYYMIGKIEFLLYFDFIGGTYYFQSITFAECFASLYIPKTTFKLIEENESYGIYKIISYVLINHDLNDIEKIKKNIKKWLNVTDDKINIDEYNLYYWIDTQNCNSNIYQNIIDSNKIIKSKIDSYYSYIKLSIIGNIYDNLNLQNSENDSLNWDISQISFIELNETPEKFNFINWNKENVWHNSNEENIVYSQIFGEGILRVTKQYFKNLTGIDLNNIHSGSLSKDQLTNLNINEPINEVNSYNRFQYWLRTEKL